MVPFLNGVEFALAGLKLFIKGGWQKIRTDCFFVNGLFLNVMKIN